MNKKSTKKSPGSSKAATSLPETARDLRALWEQTRNNASPLEQAQEIMYDAWEANSPQAAIALAEKALSLSKDCADAYNLLAATSKSPEVAVVLYRRAIEAGKRTLGKRAFKEEVGYFWGILETRPYMRALAGLAENLWLTGEREEALVVYAEGLTLNPGDNQGLRYILMPHLLELGKDDEAEKLFKKFPDDGMATWMYSRAILDFRKTGASTASRRSLKAALKANPHVPGYLLGIKKVPKKIAGSYGIGDDSEAALYAYGNAAVWGKTAGVLDWLKAEIA